MQHLRWQLFTILVFASSTTAAQTWEYIPPPSRFVDVAEYGDGTTLALAETGDVLRRDGATGAKEWVHIDIRGFAGGVAVSGSEDGIVVGDSGSVAFTTNGGRTWTAVAPGTAAHLHRVAYLDPWTVVSVGSGGVIIRSIDRGATWYPVESGVTGGLWGLSFADRLHGWAVGDGGVVLRTTDGGVVWSRQQCGTGEMLRAVSFASPTDGVAVGWNRTIRRTTDAGGTWDSLGRLFGGYYLEGVAMLDKDRIVTVGNGGSSEKVMYTTDGGATWTLPFEGLPQWAPMTSLLAVSARDGRNAFVAGEFATFMHLDLSTGARNVYASRGFEKFDMMHDLSWQGQGRLVGVLSSGNVLLSSDRGATWSARVCPSYANEQLMSCAAEGNDTTWVLGLFGRILRVRDSGEMIETGDAGLGGVFPKVGRRHAMEIRAFGNGFVMARGTHELLWTSDRFRTYRRVPLPVDTSFTAVGAPYGTCVDSNTIMICHLEGNATPTVARLLRSTDRGATWDTLEMRSGLRSLRVFMRTTEHGFMCPDSGIEVTTNGGETWRRVDSTCYRVMGVAFLDDTLGFAVASYGRVVRTTDGGFHWNSIDVWPGSIPDSMRMPTFIRAFGPVGAFFGGYNSVFFRTTLIDSLTGSVGHSERGVPDCGQLHVPGSCTPSDQLPVIGYVHSSDRPRTVSFGMFDCLGRCLWRNTAVVDVRGVAAIAVERSNLAPGLYFVTATAGDCLQVKELYIGTQ